MNLMERRYGSRSWTAWVVVLLIISATSPVSGEAGFLGTRGSAAVRNPINLSLKISNAKKRKRQVSFYKSVARQAKLRATVDRLPSSGR